MQCNVMFIHITKEKYCLLRWIISIYHATLNMAFFLMKMNSDYYYLFLFFGNVAFLEQYPKCFTIFSFWEIKFTFRSMKDSNLPAFLCSRVIIHIIKCKKTILLEGGFEVYYKNNKTCSTTKWEIIYHVSVVMW
jgi:hypothetical protein